MTEGIKGGLAGTCWCRRVAFCHPDRVPLQACTPCAPGYFKPPVTADAPIPTGPAVCLPCTPGSYSGRPAAAACAKCPTSGYQNGSAATACEACPDSSRAPAPGALVRASCKCATGFVGPRGGPCVKCPAGYTAPLAEMTACVQVPSPLLLSLGRVLGLKRPPERRPRAVLAPSLPAARRMRRRATACALTQRPRYHRHRSHHRHPRSVPDRRHR
jgi:hypothetical protein